MNRVYIDSANLDGIKEIFDTLKQKDTDNMVEVVGITTNPNAFFKVNKLHLQEWLDTLPALTNLISSYRHDKYGVVYIQCPNCDMSADEIFKYCDLLLEYSSYNGNIGIKIPPYESTLEIVKTIQSKGLLVNVTGVSDCATALKSLNYTVDVVSVIPGRMEEVGIDAKNHVSYVIGSAIEPYQHIIAGSMRTIEGLKWTLDYGTVPTIGEKVWKLIFEGDNFSKVFSREGTSRPSSPIFPPDINHINRKLSEDFFIQMNKCGEVAHKDFKSLNV